MHRPFGPGQTPTQSQVMTRVPPCRQVDCALETPGHSVLSGSQPGTPCLPNSRRGRPDGATDCRASYSEDSGTFTAVTTYPPMPNARAVDPYPRQATPSQGCLAR